MPIPHERHTIGANPNRLFEDGPDPGLEPVGGEFQPRLEIGYPGAGAHLIFVLIKQLLRLTQKKYLSTAKSRSAGERDVIFE
jgi:hypothetical protein